MSQRNRDFVLLSWPAASFVTVRTVFPCLVNIWFMWKWTPQGDRAVILKNAMLPTIPFNSQGTLFIHPPFIFLFIKQNYGCIYWISLFVPGQLCLPQPKQGQKHEEGKQVPLEFCHISVTKRNDHWRRTWLNYGKICLPGNAEYGLPKYMMNDWLFFADKCTKKYAAIWLFLCTKCDPIAAYHWRMILCPGLIS